MKRKRPASSISSMRSKSERNGWLVPRLNSLVCSMLTAWYFELSLGLLTAWSLSMKALCPINQSFVSIYLHTCVQTCTRVHTHFNVS